MFSLVSQKVLPQPPSANKKKNYEIQEVLGTGSFGKVMVRPSSSVSLVTLTDSVTQRATWHVERRQTGSPSTSPTASPAKRPPLPPSRAGSADSVSQDVTLEVALKAIPKKKVKGDEESVFSEMRVLQGLDHPNIVRPPHFPPSHR
jgi:calcium/calmodulin-dependent protein kinase I